MQRTTKTVVPWKIDLEYNHTHASTTGDRIVFEVFCKAIAHSSTTSDRFVLEVFYKAIAHSSITGDRIIFEVFCNAIAHPSTTGDRFVFEVFCKAIAHSSTTGDRLKWHHTISDRFGSVRNALAFAQRLVEKLTVGIAYVVLCVLGITRSKKK